MHVISENVYAECFDGNKVLPNGKGKIILTNLHNRATPLIRYNQEDIVVLEPPIKCGCGYTDKIVTSLIGRVSSMAIVNGKNLLTCDVSDIMLIVENKYGHPIKKYKFIYEVSKKRIICYTLFNDLFINWHQEIWNMIRALFKKKYGNINMDFVMGDYDNGTYKHDLLIVK